MLNQDAYALGAAPSAIREVFEYGRRQAKLLGEDKVFDFSLGNPSIPAPDAVNEAIHTILKTESSIRVHGYTSGAGSDELRTAVAENLRRRFGTPARPEQIFITCGAAPALTSVLEAVSAPGSEVIAIAPFFPEYRPFTNFSGSHFVPVMADRESFQPDTDALEKAINAHTQAVIINSPNNPSGAVFREDVLKDIAALLRERAREYGHPIYIISDEPYRELVYDGQKVPFLPNLYEDTVVCYSWSKSLSLPGERIGYVYVPGAATDSRELFLAVAGSARMHGHVCAPSLIQRAVAQCIDSLPDLSAYDENRKLLYEGLTESGYSCVRPDGAFYLFVRTPGEDNDRFSRRAMEKNLLLVPSEPFGVSGFFRLGYCVAKETIERALPVFRELIR